MNGVPGVDCTKAVGDHAACILYVLAKVDIKLVMSSCDAGVCQSLGTCLRSQNVW